MEGIIIKTDKSAHVQKRQIFLLHILDGLRLVRAGVNHRNGSRTARPVKRNSSDDMATRIAALSRNISELFGLKA